MVLGEKHGTNYLPYTLDWLSELENTNYFVDDDNMQINLYGVIRRLKEIYNPSWNSEANAAHDIR